MITLVGLKVYKKFLKQEAFVMKKKFFTFLLCMIFALSCAFVAFANPENNNNNKNIKKLTDLKFKTYEEGNKIIKSNLPENVNAKVKVEVKNKKTGKKQNTKIAVKHEVFDMKKVKNNKYKYFVKTTVKAEAELPNNQKNNTTTTTANFDNESIPEITLASAEGPYDDSGNANPHYKEKITQIHDFYWSYYVDYDTFETWYRCESMTYKWERTDKDYEIKNVIAKLSEIGTRMDTGTAFSDEDQWTMTSPTWYYDNGYRTFSYGHTSDDNWPYVTSEFGSDGARSNLYSKIYLDGSYEYFFNTQIIAESFNS